MPRSANTVTPEAIAAAPRRPSRAMTTPRSTTSAAMNAGTRWSRVRADPDQEHPDHVEDGVYAPERVDRQSPGVQCQVARTHRLTLEHDGCAVRVTGKDVRRDCVQQRGERDETGRDQHGGENRRRQRRAVGGGVFAKCIVATSCDKRPDRAPMLGRLPRSALEPVSGVAPSRASIRRPTAESSWQQSWPPGRRVGPDTCAFHDRRPSRVRPPAERTGSASRRRFQRDGSHLSYPGADVVFVRGRRVAMVAPGATSNFGIRQRWSPARGRSGT